MQQKLQFAVYLIVLLKNSFHKSTVFSVYNAVRMANPNTDVNIILPLLYFKGIGNYELNHNYLE